MKPRSIQPCWVLGLTLLSLAWTSLGQQKQKKPKGPPAGVSVERDIVYTTHDGIDLKLDLYTPKTHDGSPLPVVMWVHGGGWLNGSRDNCKIAYLANEGFAVASVGYRLTDVAQWPGQIEDLYAATRWLREQADERGFDGDHIGAMGSSAGGHLVALLGTRPNAEGEIAVEAVCDWYGPSDLLTMPPNNVSETRTLEQVANSNGAKLLGATVRDVPEKAKDASALHQVDAGDAPFLIMHGSEDPGVPLEQSERLHTALEKAGVPSEFVVVEGAGHGGPEFNTDEVKAKVAEFFERWLR